jgi:hypothetical protein
MLILPEYFFKKYTGLYHLQNQLKYNTGTLLTSVPVLKNCIMVEMLKKCTGIEKNESVPVFIVKGIIRNNKILRTHFHQRLNVSFIRNQIRFHRELIWKLLKKMLNNIILLKM